MPKDVLSSVIESLKAERAKVERAIATLEALLPGNTSSEWPRSTRGRRSMGAEERRQVSERMKRYWEKRHAGSES